MKGEKLREIKIGDHLINDDSLPFFISEVGSNHQGDVEHCKKLILASKEAGASAVIQPSGSVRDKEIIKFANETDTILVFSKTRHFRH